MRKRNNTVSFRLTDEEAQMLNTLQQKTGMPKRTLIMELVNGAQLAPADYTEAMKELVSVTVKLTEQTKRIGVNVNQIARVANSTGDLYCLNELAIIQNQLSQLLKVEAKLYGCVQGYQLEKGC